MPEETWKAFSLRLPIDLVERIDELAKADHRPRTNWIEVQLRAAVDRKDALEELAKPALRLSGTLTTTTKDGTT